MPPPPYSSCLSVRPSAWNKSVRCRLIFYEILYSRIYENLRRKLNFYYNLTIMAGTLREDVCSFMMTYGLIILRMRNVSDKSCRENQNTFCVQYTFFPKIYHLWDNVKKIVEPNRPHITILRCLEETRFTYRITTARIQTHADNM
jgi:hypothetical protein